jgi:hypothetical protein
MHGLGSIGEVVDAVVLEAMQAGGLLGCASPSASTTRGDSSSRGRREMVEWYEVMVMGMESLGSVADASASGCIACAWDGNLAAEPPPTINRP